MSQAFLQELHQHAHDSVPISTSPSRLAATVTDVRDPIKPAEIPSPRQSSVSRWGTGVGNTYNARPEQPRIEYREVYQEPIQQQRPAWMTMQQRVYDSQQRVYDSEERVYDSLPRAYDSQQRAYDSQQKTYDPQQRFYEEAGSVTYDTYKKTFGVAKGSSPLLSSAWETTVPLNDEKRQSYAELPSKQFGVHLQHPFPSLIDSAYHTSPHSRQYVSSGIQPTTQSTLTMAPPQPRPSVTLPSVPPTLKSASSPPVSNLPPTRPATTSAQSQSNATSPSRPPSSPAVYPSSPAVYLPQESLPPPKISTVHSEPPQSHVGARKPNVSDSRLNKGPIRLSPTVDWQGRSRAGVVQGTDTSNIVSATVNPRVNPFDIAIRTIPRVTTTSTASSSQRSTDFLYEKKVAVPKNSRVPTLQPQYESRAPAIDSPVPRSPNATSRRHVETKVPKANTRSTRKVPREQIRRPPTLESETQSRDGFSSYHPVRPKQDKGETMTTSKSPLISDEDVARTSSPKSAGRQKRSDVSPKPKNRSQNIESARKAAAARKSVRSSPSRRSRQIRDSVTDDSKGDAVSVPHDVSREHSADEANPVLAQIQSAVTELATICKSLTESHHSGRRSIERLGQKPPENTAFSPRTLTELTEKVSRNVTTQVLDSLFHQLYQKEKVSPSSTSTTEDETNSNDEATSRHRAFSWSETLGKSTKRRLRQMARVKHDMEMLKSAHRDHMSVPENHTVSSTSPVAVSSLYGRRPDVHTYGGGQLMYPPWLLPPTFNPFLPPMSPMDPLAMQYFSPLAQMIAASQNAFTQANPMANQNLGGQPNLSQPPAEAVDGAISDNPPRLSPSQAPASPSNIVPITKTAPHSQLTASAIPAPTAPRNERLESRQVDKFPRAQSKPTPPPRETSSQTASSAVHELNAQVTGMNRSLDSVTARSHNHQSSDVYDGVQIQALHIPAPESLAESFASSSPPIRRVSSNKARGNAVIGASSVSPIRDVARKAMSQPPVKRNEQGSTGVASSSTTRTEVTQGRAALPQQEVLYTLRIDTFHGDNMERRRDSWAKTREVDVIQVYKDPEILVLPELVTSEEIALILRSAEGLWTDHPRPGEVIDELTRMDAYGRIITSQQQISRRNQILIAPLSPDASPCVGRVERRLAATAQMEVSDIESIYLLRYAPGSYLPAHVDGHYEKTAIIFLNDVGPGGGSIAFLKLGLQIQPQQGTAVLWSNIKCNERGRPQLNGRSIHCDQPHPSHEKLLLLCLFKDRSRA